MARPSRNSGETPAEERIRQAFWDLLQEKPLEDISIGEVTKRAHCNRGTFYYYFTDKYDLLERVVHECLPMSIPQLMLSIALDHGDMTYVYRAAEDNREAIDKLCILLNTSAAEDVRGHAREAVAALWREMLAIDVTDNADATILFEFFVNGLLGVLAYRGRVGCKLDIATCTRTLAPEIPEAILKCIERCGGHAADMLQVSPKGLLRD